MKESTPLFPGKTIAHRAGLVCLLVFLAVLHVEAAASPPGLDTRPANTTCLAFDRPDTNASISLQHVYPSLPISNVVAMTQAPGDASYWYFTTRDGIIGRFANTPAVSSWDILLDLSMSTGSGKVTIPSDGGLIQLVFHPDYPNDPRVFVNYSTTGTHLRPNDIIISSFVLQPGSTAIDELSEVVYLVQRRGDFHQGGFMSFGPDGLLYFGFGDGTLQKDPYNLAQNVTDMRGSILRIDVDNIPGGEAYGIPPDNPYAGNARCGPTNNPAPCPEIFAPGFRNPFRGDIDPVTGDIWVGDVGYQTREEVDKVVKGGNYGWNVYEGSLCQQFSGSCADTSLIGPVVDFSHGNGQCAVIGGYVYRGSDISGLQGRYVFADYCTSKVSAVQHDTGGNAFEEILLPGGSGIGLINTFARDNAGELYVVTGTQIYKITDNSGGGTTTAPATLSQTGCFDAVDPTIPAPGLIPFDINAPLWSDGAGKKRWIALQDGTTVSISADGDFLFPPGTVLIKEFSYNGVPHETRLLVRHLDGVWAGYSYEWRADGSDADLLPAGKVKVLPSGATWTYPSRAECLRCHTDSANFSLGPEVGQLNREMLYPQTLRVANELQTLDHIGIFTSGLPAGIENLPAYAGLGQTQHSVAYRARSYLHSNCSGCHRPGEVTQAPMDFRFSTPTAGINACNVTPVFGDLGVTGATILTPGSPGLSVTRLRDASRDPLIQMPPLGTAVAHDEWLALLDSWISDPTLCNADIDTDLDGVLDKLDNCPAAGNASQRDTDLDGIGDACELTANAGVDQYVPDLGADGTEQVSLDGSGSTAPVPSDPISTWTWRENSVVIASGQTAMVSLATGVHLIQLEIQTAQGATAVDMLAVTVLADTDSDGILDIYDSDDDNDGIPDIDEPAYGTDPLLADTDGDGFDDGMEVAYGSDPSLGSDTPAANYINNGDINNDSKVDVVDVLLATRIILDQLTPSTDQQIRADMVPDQQINAGDLLRIQQRALAP